MNEPAPRFALQDAQYDFPYHYLPQLDADGGATIGRWLSWGLEYLAYQKFVDTLIRGLNPDSVLEVGCGDGRLIGSLPPGIGKRVGIDLSERAIAFARAFNPAVQFVCGSAGDLPDEFDVVAAIEVLEHVPDDEVGTFLEALRARVRPGGHLVLSVPTTVLPLNRKHYRHYDEALMRKQLQLAGLGTFPQRYEFVFRESALLRWLRRCSINRFWTIEVRALSRFMWRHIERQCLRTDSASGRHLVVTISL